MVVTRTDLRSVCRDAEFDAYRQDGSSPEDVIEAEEYKDVIVLRPLIREDCIKRKVRALVYAGSVTGDIGKALDDSRKMHLDRVAGRRVPS